MADIEKTMRQIKELVTRQAEVDALLRIIEYAESEVKRLREEVSELSAKYDLD